MTYPDGRRCRDSGSAGFTLVEVMVATMASAMMVTAFMSVAVTSRMQTYRVNHKLAATQRTQMILDKLGGYVADSSVVSGLPNSGVLADEKTCFPGVSAWALSVGVHDVSCVLTSDPAFAGMAGVTLKYCVADVNTTQGCPGMTNLTLSCDPNSPFKCVSIEAKWSESGA